MYQHLCGQGLFHFYSILDFWMNCPFKTYLSVRHWSWRRAAHGDHVTGSTSKKTAWHSRSISCFWRFQAPRLRHSTAQNKLVRKRQDMSARLKQFLEINRCQNTSRGPNTNRNSSLNSYVWRGNWLINRCTFGLVCKSTRSCCSDKEGEKLPGLDLVHTAMQSYEQALHSRGWEPQH